MLVFQCVKLLKRCSQFRQMSSHWFQYNEVDVFIESFKKNPIHTIKTTIKITVKNTIQTTLKSLYNQPCNIQSKILKPIYTTFLNGIQTNMFSFIILGGIIYIWISPEKSTNILQTLLSERANLPNSTHRLCEWAKTNMNVNLQNKIINDIENKELSVITGVNSWNVRYAIETWRETSKTHKVFLRRTFF
jgi:hypothetical protein